MCCSDTDTSGQIAAAQANERVGMRALDINEKQFARQSALQDEFMDVIRQNQASDEEVKGLQSALMRDQQDRRENIFNPLEDKLVAEAENFDSADRMSSEMGKADAAVVKAYDRAVQAAGKDQLRLGVNPNSAKSQALRENGSLALATRAANASTAAGERTKAKGFAMRMDAAGLGRNLATNQTAAANSALAASQGQTSAFSSGISAGNQNMSTMNQGFGTASNAFTSAGNLYGAAAEAEAASDPMNSIAGLAGYGVKTYMSQGKVC